MDEFLKAKRNYFYIMRKAALAKSNLQRIFLLRALQGAKKKMIKAHQDMLRRQVNGV